MSQSTAVSTLKCERAGFRLEWDAHADRATLTDQSTRSVAWRGSLLPLFWLQLPSGEKAAVKPSVVGVRNAGETMTLQMKFDTFAVGELHVSTDAVGISFDRLSVSWLSADVPAIIGLYFGASLLTPDERDTVPSLEHPFWPDWSAEGFCVPSAKGAPVQSFFRCWDFGSTTIPLGSFGPAMGTPYAAAYPRPLFAAAAGGPVGWLVAGAGAIPDAAMSFQVRSSCAMLHWLYREDLHGAGERERVWDKPLRLAWANIAWEAYRRYFSMFEACAGEPPRSRANVNSWGAFKTGDFDIPRLTDHAASLGAELLVIDDFWESTLGSGEPHYERFPAFDADLAYIRSKQLALGFWQSVGWVDDPAAVGLTNEDLLCAPGGRPRRANWSMNPRSDARAHFCLDPSSPKTRAFLIRRTQTIMRRYKPELLKLDFGYGLPGPDVAVPRDPRVRGERLAYELLRLIIDAAREISPDVAIQYYGLHPLMRPVTDVIALDDLGDAGSEEIAGHGQWSVWSALAGDRGTVIMASSGYDWTADADVLLNSAVIGVPGSVLRPMQADGSVAARLRENRRRALNLWYRRTTRWQPLWLDSTPGDLSAEPATRCWGRLEALGGSNQLTSLALRPTGLQTAAPESIPAQSWTGRWALIAQDDRGIAASERVACIPFDAGTIQLQLDSPPLKVIAVTTTGERPATEARIAGVAVHIEVTTDQLADLVGYLVVRS